MVQKYIDKDFLNLLVFLKSNRNSDFYYTKDNIRIFIDSEKKLKTLLKESRNIYLIKEKGDVCGAILIWKSFSTLSKTERFFVKINSLDIKVGDKLLTVLLWNFSKELYVKLKKGSSLLDVFKNKGFRFIGDRGKEILLFRSKPLKIIAPRIIKEEIDERSNNTNKN